MLIKHPSTCPFLYLSSFPPITLINLNIVLTVIRCWMLPWAEDMNGQNIEWNSVFSQVVWFHFSLWCWNSTSVRCNFLSVSFGRHTRIRTSVSIVWLEGKTKWSQRAFLRPILLCTYINILFIFMLSRLYRNSRNSSFHTGHKMHTSLK